MKGHVSDLLSDFDISQYLSNGYSCMLFPLLAEPFRAVLIRVILKFGIQIVIGKDDSLPQNAK